MRKKKVLLVFLVLFVVCSLIPFAYAQLSTEEFNTIRITGQGVVDRKGNLGLKLDWKIPTNALYIEIKRNYPNPYVLLRDFVSQRAAFELANAKIEYDDAQNQLHLQADLLGASVNRRGRWEIDMGKGTDCIWMEKQKAIFLQIFPTDTQIIQVMDTMINLPGEASNIKYDEKKGLLTYSLPVEPRTGYCELDLSLRCKPRLMAATYKVYANPDMSEGSMWVAKTIFKNTGESNIHNLKVSYKLGEYSDWSIPKSYSLIVPGGCVVDLYYPVISSKVTELLTRTPVDAQIKYEYRDEEGNIYSDVTGERMEILGINQMEFCNLTMEERTGSWADNFSNSPLLATWVTHLDPPVKALAGMVSQLAGGVPTALDPQSAIKFCRALYDLEVTHRMAYQTPSGFLQEYVPGQDVKYPRDVLRDKSGTCVDLAILYASVCQAVGLETILVTIPGHCFPVVILPGGRLLPVECTAISGVAVGQPQVKSFSFDKAVEFASKEFSELRMGLYYLVNVKEMQQQGLVSPELPRLDADILERWGWQLPQAQRQEAPGGDQVEERGRGAEELVGGGTQRYSSEQLKFSFNYPQGWRVKEEQGTVNVENPQGFAWITMWRVDENVDPQTYLQNAENYLKQKWQDYTVTSRSKVIINGVDALRVDGHYTESQGTTEIFAVLVLHQNSQAKLMVGSGIAKEQYTSLFPVLRQVLISITLLDEIRAQATPPQTSEQPTETAQPSGDGSEGIKILRDSARGADPLPLPQRTPPKDWVHFAHPTIFTLKLIRPPDWKEEVMQDPSGYYGGLKIISPDEQANLFVYYEVVFGAVTLEEAIREGIYLLTGSESQAEILVEDDLRKVVSAMWPGAECLFVAFRSQGKVGVLLSITFPHGQGATAATSVQLKGCIGPADKFDNLVKEVFYKVFGWVGAGGYTTPAPRG